MTEATEAPTQQQPQENPQEVIFTLNARLQETQRQRNQAQDELVVRAGELARANMMINGLQKSLEGQQMAVAALKATVAELSPDEGEDEDDNEDG